MKSFLHAFRLTFRRFLCEILAFWIFIACLFAMVASHPPELDRARYMAGYATPDYSMLEVLGACWLVLRLALSEPVLLTQGGWRTRPITRVAAWGASFAVLALALLPALLARLILIATLTMPDPAVWLDLFRSHFLWGILILGLAAVLVRLAGGLLWGRQPGPARRVACGICAVLAVVAWMHPAAARFLYKGRSKSVAWSSGGNINYGMQLPGLRDKLPAGAKILGIGNDRVREGIELPEMSELFRLSPVKGTVVRGHGVRLEVLRVEPKGKELRIDVEITLAQGKPRYPVNPTLLLHFPGEDYSLRQHVGTAHAGYPLYGFPVTRMRCDGSYAVPEANPDWQRLLPQLELLVFRTEDNFRRPTYDPKGEPFWYSEPEPKRKELPPVQPGIAGAVAEVFNGLDHVAWDKWGPFKEKAKTIPREGMPQVLARHPWSDASWEFFVRPFLLKHADESDKPALLERMTNEPRLGEIFIAKGWKAEAMPLLKRFAHDRLPLDVLSVTALLDEKDPALAADIAALALRLPGDLSSLEAKLREYPGFDWPGFVRQGWRLRKYAFHMEVQTQPFDLWAAREGDAIAFRFIAEKAARHESGYEERLRSLVTGQPQDAVGYVRTNLGKMKFDAGTKTWSGE